MSFCEQPSPAELLWFAAAGRKQKSSGHAGGESEIGIVGADDMGSVMVGIATGPLRLCLEEAKWTI